MQLDEKIEDIFRLKDIQKKALASLRIESLRDLLFHFPNRYENIRQIKTINELETEESAIIYGKIANLKPTKIFRKNIPATEGKLYDATGKIKILWFYQPYIAKTLKEDSPVKIYGKLSGKGKNKYLVNPEFELLPSLPADPRGSLFEEETHEKQKNFPIYPESKGITSKWFYHKIKNILTNKAFEEIKEPIPTEILKKYNLPTLKTALIWIHAPAKKTHSKSAKKRFAFEEVFYIQLLKSIEHKKTKEKHALKIDITQKALKGFIKTFPFTLTNSQKRAINEVIEDFKKGHPMTRLLEGDVGSGKTAVAAATIYAITQTPLLSQKKLGALQTAYMVPTEVLAEQHFDSFIKYFSHLPVKIGLLTSNKCKKFPSKTNPEKATKISKNQLLKWVENGEIPILIGTHSLIQKKVKFKNLGYTIIDEQHRFGTIQRKELTTKNDLAPHLLSMTATPIPRTLALTIYGDLDISILDEMPSDRKTVKTHIMTPSKREETYEKVKREIKKGRQAFVICPRIDEPDPEKEGALNAKSAKEEATRLKRDVFPEFEVGLLHGKLTPTEKEETMRRFEKNEIQILVSTAVVEVGINVPNASVMIIEGAERFGLAQLHQFRGRIIRSTFQPYCFIFSESKSKKSIERLKALIMAKNGFQLAEYDLKQRGGGELYGRRQWGITDIGMEAIRNIKMVEAARKEAKKIVENDKNLKNYPTLKKLLDKKQKSLHFE